MALEKRTRPESLDYFLAAIAPVFIIGMIGSLVYFIITVCYQGSYTERLMWILGLYTVAAVLIARIAIEQSRQVAFAYMLALAAATLFVTPQFFVVSGAMAVFSLPILVVLLVLIAILADRITFDCTSMNEQVQSTGVGLLQSLGLVKSERKRSEPKSTLSIKADEVPTDASKKKSTSKRKHNPGVWVLYFSLFALPLFGLGQLVIQSDLDRRWAFTYLFFYLLNSLFLLVLISLLSLRKYLRERGVPMETSFAARWLVIGMTSVFAILLVLSLLPIPGHSLFSMDLPFRVTSRDDLKANKWGWGREGAVGDGPKQGEEEAQEKPGGNQDGRGPDEGGKQVGDKTKEGKQSDESPKNGDPQKGESKSINDDSKNNDTKSQGNEKGKPEDGDKRDEDEKKDGKPEDNNPGKNKEPAPQKEPKQNKNQPGDAKRTPPEKQPEGKQPQQQQQTAPRSLSIQWNLSAAVQWLLMLVLAIVAIVYGVLYRAQLLAAIKGFRDWLSVFGRKKRSLEKANQSVDDATILEHPFPPFHTFESPFATGNGWSREQVIRHMYRAILSWGYEHRVVCREDETPEEFMRRLFRRFPEQQESFSMLGMLYNRIAYARGKVSSSELKPMTDLWQWLVTKPPM